MSDKMWRGIEIVIIAVITFVIALSSPLNPWLNNSFTEIQTEILDTAFKIRNGYLAYTEVDGHYGPVLYEFFVLGYLPKNTHVLQFILELAILYITVLFQYKTAKLFTSRVFAIAAAGIITILGWGSLTHAGAEEYLFFILSLSVYHIAKQLKKGYLSYHTYLLAMDMGLVFFLQPGYVFIWVVALIALAIKFKLDRGNEKLFKSYIASILEGIVTVSIPPVAYFIYFSNAREFFEDVVVYNMKNIGGFAEGIKLVCATPWFIFLPVMVVLIILAVFKDREFAPQCWWLGFMMLTIIVIALQGDNLDSFIQLSKAIYIVPLATLFSWLEIRR